jgi:hypothetical protein
MFAVQISDRSTFVRRAKKLGVPVQVLRMATVVPVQRSGAVVMHPAVKISYTIEFDDPSTGHTQWGFREVVLADDRGDVVLSDSLLHTLNADPDANVRMVHRSGSF